MAMDLTSAVQWWEEWQLRILVVGSLFLQSTLFAGSMVRNFRVPMSRLCIWLAYLGADALAIYALATLFNRHKLPPGAGGSSVLEVLWAPVLLIHLGGQHPITAYSIEDNELWRRHIVTMVSQVTVALYVFCKSWPHGGDKRLLQAAILLFIVGILKFIQKPWVLKKASIGSAMASSAVYPRPARRQGKLRIIFDLCFASASMTSGEDATVLSEDEEQNLSLEQYVQEARTLVRVTEEADHEDQYDYFRMHDHIENLLGDVPVPYSRRCRQLRSFLKLDDESAYDKLIHELSLAFGMTYTNTKSLVVLFAMAMSRHKDYDYDKNDIKVSIVLLCCTTLLEVLPFFLSPCLVGMIIEIDMVPQHNLMAFSARSLTPTNLMKFSALIGCRNYINKYWYIERAPESSEITKLVVRHVKDGWKHYIGDGASYKKFSYLRGQWTMRKHGICERQLRWSLEVPFDQSVVIWHIATDICLHHSRASPTPTAAVQYSAARWSMAISNYMIYLLLIRPEMLMPGTRQSLFTTTSYEIRLMLAYVGYYQPVVIDICQMILHVSQFPYPYPDGVGTFILKACRLAEDLVDRLGNEEERWEMIQGVWVEMLCCSASSCRGYLHAKSMGEGLEFLTIVWLLLKRMGMETFGDKLQKPEFGDGVDIDAGTSAS